ncbi:hypothetical protein C8F01DRAFT_1098629 [Mycena amicta]|nr:hypothetical protein C8F01DRAFT_1166854 [Mycena amicta]KAJ7059081.1 hypothetical protein C8F01DRAFT_272423 [Mycena amicta]KAJ7073892.1 hypothetical protein C8F01DRAFT_1098629 [Mycena amicta]
MQPLPFPSNPRSQPSRALQRSPEPLPAAAPPRAQPKPRNKSGQAPAPVVSVPVAPADLSQAPAEAPTKPKRSATWKPSYKSIAQQLCAQHWLQTHGKGKKKDFELFWDELTAAQKNVRVVLLIQVHLKHSVGLVSEGRCCQGREERGARFLKNE